ncbi:MAG: 2-oxoglutarate dehydrogenase subunit E1, partial [Chlamydiae bacterium]|nr:2-oxoglutarate dehydrogenase subunit E1 [Chlamydiota bacterium]
EGDEPSYTQPIQYQKIRSKKTIRQIYFESLLKEGHVEQKIAEILEEEFKERLKKALEEVQTKTKKEPTPTSSFDPFSLVQTGVNRSVLKEIIETFCNVPKDFHLHPKLEKWLQDRKKSLDGKVDWAAAECLAFGSLLLEKNPIRLAGQDSRRGTFSQRHMVWTDTENGSFYRPMKAFGEDLVEILNSPLSEYACLGFEYGYSCQAPNALVCWEAQYGDFVNGGEIIIDQYIASGEQKWNIVSALTLLLPHAYEGAGPEHSSCRFEKFLQLAAANNLQVVNPSTPAQYFHVLRRQVKRSVKKPLVILTPKSLLRSSFNTSLASEFEKGSFQEILDDPMKEATSTRLLLCSGKIFYDLLQEKEKRKTKGVAIVRLEQYYPFHHEGLMKIISSYQKVKEIIWVQEEPENMGAWMFLAPRLAALTLKGACLKKIARPPSSTPATGSHRKHLQEQKALLDAAFEGL